MKKTRIATKLFGSSKLSNEIKFHEKILRQDQNNLEIRKALGDLYLKCNQMKEALDQFNWVADYYYKEGFLPKSIAMLKRISRIAPENEEIANKLADLYAKEGLASEAKQIYLDLAQRYKIKNQLKKSYSIYQKLLDLDKDNIKMRLFLADNLLKDGHQADAAAEYLKAADSHIKRSENKQAEELLFNSLESTGDIRILEKLARFLFSHSREDDALGLLKSHRDVFVNSYPLLKLMADLRFKKGEEEEAEKLYQRVLSINPTDQETIIQLGKIFLNRGSPEKTFELFLPTIEDHVEKLEHTQAISLMQLILTADPRFTPALEMLAKIFEDSQNSAELIPLYESLVSIHNEKNDVEGAKKYLTRLIDLSDSPHRYQDELSQLEKPSAPVQKEETAPAEEPAAEKTAPDPVPLDEKHQVEILDFDTASPSETKPETVLQKKEAATPPPPLDDFIVEYHQADSSPPEVDPAKPEAQPDADITPEKPKTVAPLEQPEKEVPEIDPFMDDIPLSSPEDELPVEHILPQEGHYWETELNSEEERLAINYWVGTLTKFRSSTIERNMMNIFEEFKKGVDEKIGEEDHETRYNLGIAYKEMGLIEEAIHEFMVTLKHPDRTFDSAVLLGICFRDKAMFEESLGWFERALESKNRNEEDYTAVKYEMALAFLQKDDLKNAQKYAEEISARDSSYRDITGLIEEIEEKIHGSQ